MDQPLPAHSSKTDKSLSHPSTQSDPDSQICPHQVHSTWRSCNATPFHSRNTSFAGGRGGMRYPQPWFPLSDDPKQCIRRTIRGCRPYRSSLLGYRFGRSRSSGFVSSFRRLRWCGFDRRNHVRAYCTHPTSGLKILCGLRFAMAYLCLPASNRSMQIYPKF